MKQKIFTSILLPVALLGFAVTTSKLLNAAAAKPARFTSELATLRAAQAVLQDSWYKNIDLSKITEAASEDSGRGLTIILRFKADIETASAGEFVTADCTSYHWFQYDGTPTTCDRCIETPSGQHACSCLTASCVTPDRQIFSKSE